MNNLFAPPEFVEFPKIPRLSRDIVVTEKIDGRNAVIHITEDGIMHVGSRNGWILADDDTSMGFRAWAESHREELVAVLGPGTHHGEWWGRKIGRTYGIADRRFSLFNTARWTKDAGVVAADPKGYARMAPECCLVTPVLYTGPFDIAEVDECLHRLQTHGSVAQPGFMRPEGVIVFHTASNTMFKKTLDKHDQAKGA